MAKANANSKTTAPAAKPAAKVVTKIGLVDSDKRAKTRRVVIENLSTHAKYGKIIRGRTILHVHDEQNASQYGDLVEVAPCPPVSKTKRWALVKIVQKGVGMKFEGVDAPAVAPAKPAAPAAKATPVKAAPAKK